MTTAKIEAPAEREGLSSDTKLFKKYTAFKKLVSEISKRELPESIITTINKEIGTLNAILETDKAFKKGLGKAKNTMLKTLEKELKIVPKFHYRRLWMVLGMSAFGIPIGISFGAGTGNFGMLGVGIAIGMGIGVAIGSEMDRKAQVEGRQLDVEL
jgi:hypothetical protein